VRRKGLEEEEGGADEEEEEERVVVEDGKGGGFVVGDLVLLPKNALILFFLGHLLIIGQFAHHLFGDGVFALDGHLMLQDVLRLAVSKSDEPSADDGHDQKERPRLMRVQLMNAPVQPNWNGGNDEGVAIE